MNFQLAKFELLNTKFKFRILFQYKLIHRTKRNLTIDVGMIIISDYEPL